MTNERLSPLRDLRHTWSYYVTIWRMGWSLLWKACIASLIISLFLVPLKLLGLLLEIIPYMQTETPMALTVRLILGILLIAVYLPLMCYVAGSWVGFCKRVDPDENKNS